MLGAAEETISGDGTDITFEVGSSGDINIPANIGLTFGDDGEKIQKYLRRLVLMQQYKAVQFLDNPLSYLNYSKFMQEAIIAALNTKAFPNPKVAAVLTDNKGTSKQTNEQTNE